MYIIGCMTGHTLCRCVAVAIAHVTGDALHFRMTIGQRKVRLAVIELAVQPVLDGVTRTAIITQLAFVRFIFLVAGHTAAAGLAIFLTSLMTTAARHRDMGIVQCEIRMAVIELHGNKLDDVSVTAFVFGMATMALQGGRVRQAAMKASVLLHVSGNVLVTIHAQGRLIDAIGSVVAVAAIGFKFAMGIAELARHEQSFNAGRTGRAKV